MFLSINKLARVLRTVWPHTSPCPRDLPVGELARVRATVSKHQRASSCCLNEARHVGGWRQACDDMETLRSYHAFALPPIRPHSGRTCSCTHTLRGLVSATTSLRSGTRAGAVAANPRDACKAALVSRENSRTVALLIHDIPRVALHSADKQHTSVCKTDNLHPKWTIPCCHKTRK